MAGSNFVDYVKIFARSGHGGAGSAHFRREKFVAFGGPDGGDGGKGGSIVLQGDSQYWTLIHLKYQRHQFAEDGQCGSGARSSGRDARDIVIPVPLGTVARRVVEQEDGTTLTEDVGEVTADGEQLVLLKGGRGGLGNWHFKSATNQTPRYAQPGEEGEEGTFILELKVLADVGLVGFPNAGKSTLTNNFVGSKVSIVSPKAQTTRTTVKGIGIWGNTQIIFLDTPGIFKPKRRLDRAMVASAWGGVGDADITALVVDAKRGFDDETRAIIAKLKENKIPAVLVLNKVDLVSCETLLQLCAALNDAYAFAETFMVSALNGKGVDDFYDYLAAHLPESPWYYPEEQMSDLPLKLLAAEIVREKLFLYLRQEVPYALTVEPELWERRADNSVRAEMTIYVERDSQKQIVLGRGGTMIKKIGQAARRELEELLEDRIHLFLFVKVRENWGDDPARYADWNLDYRA